jgi:hypothetical protein
LNGFFKPNQEEKVATYLWYPFNDGTGFKVLDDLMPAFGGDPAHYQSPKFGELYKFDGRATTSPAGMWGAVDNDDVWIIGHSAAGYKVLGDAVGGTIDQSEVVTRLKGCGLRANVNVNIIVYACYSGRGEGCLAEKIATQLDNEDYACAQRVYGFTKKMLTTAKRDATGAKVIHADMGTKQAPNWTPIQFVEDLVRVHKAPNPGG